MKQALSAATEASPERHQQTLLLSLGVATFVVGLDGRIVAPLLPSIAAELGTSIGVASYAVSFYLLPYGLFQLAFGPLGDRFGKIRVASYAMIVFSAGTAVCGAFPGLAALLALRALTGAAAAALIPLTIAYIGDTVPYARRQATLGLLMASSGAAQGLGTSVGGLMAEVMSWRLVFPVLGALSGVVTLGLFYAARRADVPATTAATGSYRDALRSPLRPLLGLVLVEGALFMGCFPFMSGLLEARFHSSPLRIGLSLGAAGLAQVAVAKAIRWLLARLGEERLVLLGGLSMAAAYLLCAVATNVTWVTLAAALLGGGFSLCHSTLQARDRSLPSWSRALFGPVRVQLVRRRRARQLCDGRAHRKRGLRPQFRGRRRCLCRLRGRGELRRHFTALATAHAPRSKSRCARPCSTKKRFVPSSSARPSGTSGSALKSDSG